MDTIRTEITGESREVDILAGDREIQIREEALEVIEETVAASEEADFVADESADEADFDADETADEAMSVEKFAEAQAAAVKAIAEAQAAAIGAAEEAKIEAEEEEAAEETAEETESVEAFAEAAAIEFEAIDDADEAEAEDGEFADEAGEAKAEESESEGTVPVTQDEEPEAEAAESESADESAEAEAEESESEGTVPLTQNAAEDKVRVIGVRFKTAGKVYYFDPGKWQVAHGGHVIVETVRGIEYGTVVGLPMEVDASKVTQPLKEVIRVATPEDTEIEIRNRLREKEAYRICQEKIHAHGLEMKLINAEYTFDNSKVLFYFTADGRVDFRDLVKDLASVFRTRIELRQIGVRDETKILGGYGICGRPLCCHTWMSDFIPVSIKMAKEQNLSLNPTKISGVCGRLMCCLKNEADTYEELNRNLPKVGDEVRGNDGLSGQVESVNVLRQTMRILVEVDDEKEYHEYHVDDVTILRRRRRGGNRNRKDAADPKEVQELEKLENQERQMNGGSRGERQNRQDRGDRQNRNYRNDRQNGDDAQNRGERQDNGERQNRNYRGDRQNGDDAQNRNDRGDRNNRRDRNYRNDRQNGDDAQNRGDRNFRRNNRRRNNPNGGQNTNGQDAGQTE